MKIAHLILVHSGPEQLDRMVRKIMHPDVDIYVHIDAKVSTSSFRSLERYENVYFVKQRVAVRWGGFSMVQATLNGLDMILDKPVAYGYINVLSGQDYPLTSAEVFHSFLRANQGKVFMEYRLINEDWTEAKRRYERYYFTDKPFFGSYFLENLVSNVLPKRKMPLDMEPVGRSQWFTMSGLHANFILEFLSDFPEVTKFFKTTWGSDEFFFQTILFNSDYRNDMVNDNLRYIDWSEGIPSPKVFTEADADRLLKSGKFFARKFKMKTEPGILNIIDKHIDGMTIAP